MGEGVKLKHLRGKPETPKLALDPSTHTSPSSMKAGSTGQGARLDACSLRDLCTLRLTALPLSLLRSMPRHLALLRLTFETLQELLSSVLFLLLLDLDPSRANSFQPLLFPRVAVSRYRRGDPLDRERGIVDMRKGKRRGRLSFLACTICKVVCPRGPLSGSWEGQGDAMSRRMQYRFR